MQTETDKKDYILNIRISRALYDKVTKKAYENRETTSHLLRKIIEDSAEIVGDLSEELFHTDRHKKQKPRAAQNVRAESVVLVWNKMPLKPIQKRHSIIITWHFA